MKSRVLGKSLWLLAVFAGASWAQHPESLEEMKVHVTRVAQEEKVRLCAGIARRSLDEARERYAKGTEAEGKALLHEAEVYADQAADAAIRTKKHEKQLEIDLRDLSHRLLTLKRELTPEDQPDAEAAMAHLEKLRTQLLESMFGKGKR
jgi:hypothetical protein